MSLYDYNESMQISVKDPQFASLIMAAIRKADSHNMILIERTWPEIFSEFMTRYNAPGGYLPEELPANEEC